MLAHLPILPNGPDSWCWLNDRGLWQRDWFPRACACLSRETTRQTSRVRQDAQILPIFFADSSCDGTQSEKWYKSSSSGLGACHGSLLRRWGTNTVSSVSPCRVIYNSCSRNWKNFMFGQFHKFRADLDPQITTTEILNKKSFTHSLFKIFPQVTVLFRVYSVQEKVVLNLLLHVFCGVISLDKLFGDLLPLRPRLKCFI